tara:strand:- start:51 stop:446 length:396 start_codon:yes stop_codon:yes gene_type:complete
MPIHKEKLCRRCDTIKESSEFYRRRGGTDLSPYCKACTKEQTVQRQRNFKKQCIEYKGGSCQVCGYSGYDGALEFHHLDPEGKDFAISKARLTTFGDKTKKELDKCVLLCSNHHKEVHAGLIDLSALSSVG